MWDQWWWFKEDMEFYNCCTNNSRNENNVSSSDAKNEVDNSHENAIDGERGGHQLGWKDLWVVGG